MAIVKVEGQEIPMPDDIAAEDGALLSTLRPYFPEIGEARISRTQKDGQLVVEVVKQAGRKGVSAPVAETTRLTLVAIVTTGGTQARASLHSETLVDYMEALAEGRTFPPLDVFYDGAAYWLVDGFHRHEAARRSGVTEIAVYVHAGTQREAMLYAVGANATHGLRRTNADKRRAVELLLRDSEWGQWSDREIARRTAVTHPFVAAIRTELGLSGNDYRTVERGGTTYQYSPPAPKPPSLRTDDPVGFDFTPAAPPPESEIAAAATAALALAVDLADYADAPVAQQALADGDPDAAATTRAFEATLGLKAGALYLPPNFSPPPATPVLPARTPPPLPAPAQRAPAITPPAAPAAPAPATWEGAAVQTVIDLRPVDEATGRQVFLSARVGTGMPAFRSTRIADLHELSAALLNFLHEVRKAHGEAEE